MFRRLASNGDWRDAIRDKKLEARSKTLLLELCEKDNFLPLTSGLLPLTLLPLGTSLPLYKINTLHKFSKGREPAAVRRWQRQEARSKTLLLELC